MGKKAKDYEEFDEEVETTDEELENLEPFDDEEDFEDTPESRGDVLNAGAETEGDEPDDAEEEVDEEEETDEEEVDEEEETDDEVEDDDSEESETDDETVEDGDDETVEAEAEAEDEEPVSAKAKKSDGVDDISIPKKRFDYVNAKRKEAERRLAELEDSGMATAAQSGRIQEINDRLGEIDGEFNAAVLEGDEDKLKALRAEERQLTDESMEFRLNSTRQQIKEEARYDALLERMENDYPSLNPDNDETYDPDIAAEMADLRDAFEAKGDSPETALLRALNYVNPDKADKEESKPSLRRESKSDPKPKPKKKARSTATPKKRNERVQRSQPASTSTRRSSESADYIDINELSDEELDRMDPKKLQELRGDFL